MKPEEKARLLRTLIRELTKTETDHDDCVSVADLTEVWNALAQYNNSHVVPLAELFKRVEALEKKINVQ